MGRKNGDGVWDSVYEPHLNGGRWRNNPTRNSQQINERMYIRILTELACNRFKWIGLPPSVDERYLELTLFNQALAVFYWDKDFEKFFALKGTGAGFLDMHNNPTSFQVFGNHMVNKTVYPWFDGKTYWDESDELPKTDNRDKLFDCVPIWANYMRIPDSDIVFLYARKLAAADRTIEILMQNARMTRIVAATEDQRLSMVNIMRQVDEGLPYISVTDQFDAEKVQALDVGTNPDLIDRMQLARTRLWNECMGLLGINHANQDKKERLVADEVAANDEQVLSSRSVALRERKAAAAKINTRWDMNITVDFDLTLTPDMPSILTGEF